MPIPKVSVCIDVYNYAKYLPTAIDSVLGQTMTDFELIIVDDCSSDASFSIAQSYAAQDSRIHILRNPVNMGMVRNRNVCLSLAQGEYVKFVHADDFLSSPEALNCMVTQMESNEAASLVACTMKFVNEAASSTGQSRACFPDKKFVSGTSVIASCLRTQKNLIGGPTAVLFRRSKARRGFDERYFHAADLEMWFHLLEQGCFGYMADPLVSYRWHPCQQTEKDRLTLSQANDQRALLTNYLDKPYIRLRPWLREYLTHDAARQTVLRSIQISQRRKAQQTIREYGAPRYYLNYPWCFAWKKVGKRLAFLQEQPPALTACSQARAKQPVHPKGINVVGFLKGQYGIGESSRAYCHAVANSGLPSVSINIDSREHSNRDDSSEHFSKNNPYGINLMTFSFDYARRFYRDRGSRFFEGRVNIALWYWEQEMFPTRWHSNFDYYDQIWVPTRFCLEALRAVSPIPIHQIPYPLEAYSGDPKQAEFAWQPDTCMFLCSFDFCSTLARKNPFGVIAAFRQAFTPDDKVRLVLKSINSCHDMRGREQVQRAVDALNSEGLNVLWIEEHLTGAQMRALFALADCYVSLHRSEGLGLGMAQAMSVGKPVIATAYSGNMEFMNASNSLLVNYERVELAEDYGPGSNPAIYERGSIWAEPDLEHASQQMRWIYTHPEERMQIGARARLEIKQTLDPAKTQAEILARAEQIYTSNRVV